MTENNVQISGMRMLRPRSGKAKTTMLVLELVEWEEANGLCYKGLVWNAQLFNCEPYDATLRPKQCFNCFGFGHMAKFCEKAARCALCAGAAHGQGREGEDLCPTKTNTARRKCTACNGAHAAFDRACPESKRHWDRARERYQVRPLCFEEPRGHSASRGVTAPLARSGLADSIEGEWTQVI